MTAADIATRYFPFWLIFFSVIAYLVPGGFLPIRPYIAPLLGVIMFGMGITLTREDFSGILKAPRGLIVGAIAQYSIMPLTGYIIALVLGLPPELAAGVVLVGSCPGGTASNVITFLARGDVALSVSMTATTTLLAPVLTPFFTWLYAGRWVPVPVSEMFLTVLMVILLPVVLGIAVRMRWGKTLREAMSYFPMISVVGIIAIVSCIVALNVGNVPKIGPRVFLSVFIHNGLGLALGYLLAATLLSDERKRRAISIEVGMQNSGLGVTLAMTYFSATAALPSAVFSIWHNLSGSALAAYWSSKKK